MSLDDLDKVKKILTDNGMNVTHEQIEVTVNDIDLDIAYSPVIPFENGSIATVFKIKDNTYELLGYPKESRFVTTEKLKVMRFRYLTRKK